MHNFRIGSIVLFNTKTGTKTGNVPNGNAYVTKFERGKDGKIARRIAVDISLNVLSAINASSVIKVLYVYEKGDIRVSFKGLDNEVVEIRISRTYLKPVFFNLPKRNSPLFYKKPCKCAKAKFSKSCKCNKM